MVQCPGKKPCILSQAMKTHEPSAGTLHNSYRTTWNHLEVPEPPFVVANAYDKPSGSVFYPLFCR